MDTSNDNKQVPPYLSVSRMEKVLSFVSTRSFNTLSSDYFKSQTMSVADANLAIAALRFLGLVDDEGKVTDAIKGLRMLGEPRKQALASLVKAGYKKLFDGVEKPQELPKDELQNEFSFRYDLSPRVASGAVPVFLYLCQEAGLLAEGVIKPRQRLSPPGAARPKPQGTSSARLSKFPEGSSDNRVDFPFASGQIHVSLPKTDAFTEIVLSKEFAEMTKAVTRLAEEFFVQRKDDAGSVPKAE